jgi:hypothetical protein
MFLTLTCDSYGKVGEDGTPADPGSYDYTRTARDAIHFAALVDRFVQNLRRVLGYEAQYFGGVEPQKRLAPHIHLAVRGSVPRPLLRQVPDATYHQVWWPSTDTLPVRKTSPARVRRIPKSWAFVVEPPIGIEPMTYALREARHAAPGALPAQIASHAPRNAPVAQHAPDSGPRPGPRPGQPSSNTALLDRPEWHSPPGPLVSGPVHPRTAPVPDST